MYKLHLDDVLLSRGANPRTGRISPFEPPPNSTSTSAAHCPYCYHHQPPSNPDDDDDTSITTASSNHFASLPPGNRSGPQPRRPPSASTCPARDLLRYDFELTHQLADNTVLMASSDDTSISSDSFIYYLQQQPTTDHGFFESELSRFLPPVRDFVHPSEFFAPPLRKPVRSALRRLFGKFRVSRRDSRAVGEGVWLRSALGR